MLGTEYQLHVYDGGYRQKDGNAFHPFVFQKHDEER
jgi:hypothetical protein